MISQTANMTEHMTLMREATLFATKKHEGEFRGSGDAFITHPIEVCKAVPRIAKKYGLTEFIEEAELVAMLHDVVEGAEDKKGVYRELLEIFPFVVVKDIKDLSRLDDETYAEYCERGISNIVWCLVKLCDWEHNLSTLHLAGLTPEKEEARRQKYEYHRNEVIMRLMARNR